MELLREQSTDRVIRQGLECVLQEGPCALPEGELTFHRVPPYTGPQKGYKSHNMPLLVLTQQLTFRNILSLNIEKVQFHLNG